MPTIPPTDLTQRPPRSARVRLGGYAILPRAIDKCRAVLAGTNGEYNYACPLDQLFLTFAGVNPEALKEQVANGKNDGELLEWIEANSANRPDPSRIRAWTEYVETRVPGDPDTREFFHSLHQAAAPHRKDIQTWFDLLDLDDFASFGGQA